MCQPMILLYVVEGEREKENSNPVSGGIKAHNSGDDMSVTIPKSTSCDDIDSVAISSF